MEFGLRDLIYLILWTATTTSAVWAIRTKLKDFTKDKFDESKAEIDHLKLENERLNSRLTLLEHAIEPFKKIVTDNLPAVLGRAKKEAKDDK